MMGREYMLNRTIVFLLVHVIILSSLIVLRFLGIAAEVILTIALAAISMEAICMAVFTKDAVGKTLGGIKEMEADMTQLKEMATETAKCQRALIYAGHQIRMIQQELDLLKKKAELKSNGNRNGHHRRVHQPMISHS